MTRDLGFSGRRRRALLGWVSIGLLGAASAVAACTRLEFDGDLTNEQANQGVTGDGGLDPCVTTAQSIVTSLTSDEDITLMAGQPSGCPGQANLTNIFTTPGVAGAVPGFAFRDGPRGVCLAANLPQGKSGYSTAYPVSSLRGATFDTALEKTVGEEIGDEMIASSHTMILAPVINILRHPAWGRAQETYGEDSYLLGTMGTAFVQGAQEYVPACAKHYAANNIENARQTDTSQMDDQTLHEIYGRQFEMVIQDGGVAAIMASYNLVQSTDYTDNAAHHSTQSPELLTTMLRKQFGFTGFVLSDWWAVPGDFGSCGTSSDQQKSIATLAANAGLDMELPWRDNYAQLSGVIQASQVSASIPPTAATRIVKEQCDFNLLNGTGLKTKAQVTTGQNSSTFDITNNQTHIQTARQVANEGIVLLKNGNNALPISKSAKKIAVIGATSPFQLSATDITTGTVDFATGVVHDDANVRNTVLTGDMGSSRVFADPTQYVGPYQGIVNAAQRANSTAQIVQVDVPSPQGQKGAPSLSGVMDADVFVVVAGNTPEDAGEDYTNASDRKSFRLDDKLLHVDGDSQDAVQDQLIENVATLGQQMNKPVIVVLEGGSVFEMPWLSNVSAVVMAWYFGQAGGDSLGDLLFGNINFSGKLPVTWPNPSQGSCNPANGNNCFGDEPLFTRGPGLPTPMGYYLGYRYYDNMNVKPLFPFGFGLKYTTLQYGSAAAIAPPFGAVGDTVTASVSVQNTGNVDADEVTFLFVSYPNTKRPSAAHKPVKELKGFVRTHIPAGQTVMVKVPLRISDMKWWDTTNQKWVYESGQINVMVGGSSDNLPATGTIDVTPQASN